MKQVDDPKLVNHYEYLDYTDDIALGVSTTSFTTPLISIGMNQKKYCLNLDNNFEV